ncbi:MAG: hypothetical protein ABS75_20160 [Pelagibacterium sp. SCN 63-23]|nr:MAG: hypothetical protein ABS75_20160 [Pelagibacterium sp. SCN 63-23]
MQRPSLAPQQAARLLLEARRKGIPLENLPEVLRPLSHADAHRIQDAMVETLGGVGGWKIFAGTDPEPLLSPIPSCLVFPQDHEAPPSPLRISLVELEVAVTIGHDLPMRDVPYTALEAKEAIASFHPLIELITLSWIDREQVDRITQLADLQNSAGFVVGPALTDWADFEPATAGSTLVFDNQEVGESSGGAGLSTIADTVAYLANHAARRGMPLRRGHIVTTGARLVQATGAASTIRGDVKGLGTVRTTLN